MEEGWVAVVVVVVVVVVEAGVAAVGHREGGS